MATVNLKVDLDPSGAIRGLQLVGAETRKTGKEVGGLQSILQGVGQGIGQRLLSGVTAGVGGLLSLGGTAIKLAGDFEQTEIAFGTMLGSGERARAFLGELEEFASRTPFEFPELVGASRKLLAFGFAAEDVLPIMTRVGDAAAGLGVGAEGVHRITKALGDMSAKGKVSTQEINQLAEVGIRGWEMVAKKIGVSVPEAMDRAAKGAIPAAVGIQAILEGMGERFAGMMEKQSQTLLGRVSTMKDELGFLLRDLGDAMLPAAGIIVEAASLAVAPLREIGKEAIGSKLELAEFVKQGLRSLLFFGEGAIGVARFVGNAWYFVQGVFNGFLAGLARGASHLTSFLADVTEKAASMGFASQEAAKEARALADGVRAFADHSQEATTRAYQGLESWNARMDAAQGFVSRLSAQVNNLKVKNVELGTTAKETGDDIAAAYDKKAQQAAAKLEKTLHSIADKLRDQQAAATDALAEASVGDPEGPAERLRASLAAVDREIQGRIQKGWDLLFDKLSAGDVVPPEILGATKELERTWTAVGEAKKQALIQKEAEAEEERAAKARLARVQARIERWEEEKRLQEEELQRQKELLGLVRELAGGVYELGDAWGGALGGALKFGAGALDVFVSINEWAIRARESTDKTAFALQQAGAVAQGAAQAFKSGSLLGGAAAGASAGAAFGPWGAAIGAVGGAILGLFGKGKKAREELEKLRAEIVKTYGSMEAAKEAAERLGLNLDKAFDSKDPKEVKAAMDQLARALEDQKRRVEGIRGAFDGLTLRAKGFTEQLERGSVSVEQVDRVAGQAFATWRAWVKETGDVAGALQQLGPILDAIAAAQEELGIQASGGVQALLHMRDVAAANQDVVDSLGGITQMMKAVEEGGFATRELFHSFGADAAEQFEILRGRGVDTNTALMLMQPTLQALWEGQKRFGAITDEATKGLLDQAEAQGLVGAQFQSVADKQLEIMILIAEALGARIPEAYRKAGDAAEEFGRRATAATDNVVPFPGHAGQGDGQPIPEYGRGGFLGYARRGLVVPPRLGGWAIAGEAGQAEVVAPVAALFGSLGNRIAGQVAAAVSGSGGGSPIHVHVEVGGREVQELIVDAVSAAALNGGRLATSLDTAMNRRGYRKAS